MKYLIFDTQKIIREICSEEPIRYCYEFCNNKIVFRKKSGNGILGRRTEFVFPLKIKLNPSTFGLIIGEGYIDSRQFAFVNSNENIINHVLKFLNQFNIPLYFTLELAMKNMDNGFIEDSKKAWECVVGHSIKNIRVRKEFNNTTRKGILHIRCYNSCFARVLEIIFGLSKNLVETDECFSREYIKGILAAEGNVNVKKSTGCLYMVRISAKAETERAHYKRCLEKIGIKIYCKDMPTIDKNDERVKFWKTNNGRGGAVIINRWANFYKMFSMDLLDIHENKRSKFVRHFLNNKTTKWLLEFKDLPKQWLTMREFKNMFGLKSVPRCRVDKMLSLKFLVKKRIKPKNRCAMQVYHLTGEYFKFINKLSNNTPFFNC